MTRVGLRAARPPKYKINSPSYCSGFKYFGSKFEEIIFRVLLTGYNLSVLVLVISLDDQTECSLKITRVVTISSPRSESERIVFQAQDNPSIESVRGANLEGCPVLGFKGSSCLCVTKFSWLSPGRRVWFQLFTEEPHQASLIITELRMRNKLCLSLAALLTDAALSEPSFYCLGSVGWLGQTGTGYDSCKLGIVSFTLTGPDWLIASYLIQII